MKKNTFTAELISLNENIEEIAIIKINDIVLIEALIVVCAKEFFVGEKYKIELQPTFFNEFKIEEIYNNEKSIKKTNSGMGYEIQGKYDADKQVIDLGINLFIGDDYDMFDYGYLHNKYIKLTIDRFDVCILGQQEH